MRAVLAALTLAVLVSGCTGGADGQSPQREAVSRATVTYTDSGFQPETVVLEKGGTVKWIDNSSRDMWVAVDRHPIHAKYDGTPLAEHCVNGGEGAFDQCSEGEEYSFTFEKTGTWSYHNHEKAGDTGTVIVR